MSSHQIGAAILIALLLGAGWWWEGRQDAQGKGDGWLLVVVVGLMLLSAVFTLFVLGKAHARDLGQWENSDPAVREWYQSLMQPDNPRMSCCGEADAYWADDIHVRDGRTFAVVTDDRPDEPLRRPHVDIGTEVEIPDSKLKWDKGNPSGHSVVFLSRNGFVYCFVMGSGM